jgi:hypothetical protein
VGLAELCRLLDHHDRCGSSVDLVPGYPQYELGHFLGNARVTNRLLASLAVIPLLGHQQPMPTQDGVRGKLRADLFETFSSQYLSLHRQPPALIVREQNPFRAACFFEHPVLGDQIVNKLIGLATGQERPQLAAARHSENTYELSGRRDGPVKGMGF